ncbi:MAG: hypothetical protein HGB37_03800 [Candidatus Moranbacteria bacterium]|nr:hypothetical protein [Candidatus Moranbacteria bacterium]NTW90001.1 hypothetical protein [Candidatus Moranbacteria bacterium]
MSKPEFPMWDTSSEKESENRFYASLESFLRKAYLSSDNVESASTDVSVIRGILDNHARDENADPDELPTMDFSASELTEVTTPEHEIKRALSLVLSEYATSVPPETAERLRRIFDSIEPDVEDSDDAS